MTGLENALRQAFERADAATVRQIVLANPGLRERINEPAFPFDSPALVAFAGNPAMVDVLLELGADPNRKSSWWAGGFHPLYSATAETADRLIAAGARIDACAAAHLNRLGDLREILRRDPASVHERGGDGQLPLHFARSLAAVDLLLDAGADIDARDIDHRSTAAEWMLDRRRGAGRYDLARYLVDRGATTDIFLAAAMGLTARIRTMLATQPERLALRTGRGHYGEQPPSSYHIYFWTIGDGRSALDVAVQFDQPDTLAAMLEIAPPIERLLFACTQGDEAAVRRLVLENPGIVESLTPEQTRAIADAAWSGNAKAVKLMLDIGFDPRVTGHDSGTPLHLAAWEGSAETVDVLLQHPAARELVTIKDAHHDGTPLDWCRHGADYGNRSHDHAGVERLLVQFERA